MNKERKWNSYRKVILSVVMILAVILLCASIGKLSDRHSDSTKELSSGNPPENWTWTPVPDERLAEIGQKDSDQSIADLRGYGIENNRIIDMSQRALVEYLMEDNDFNDVIMIADPQDSGCQKVMPAYADVAEEELNVNFYYVDLRAGKYKEAIRTVLASALPRDDNGKPVMKTPLVLAVNGDQTVDYQEGTMRHSESSEESLRKKYRKLAQASAGNR